MKFPRSSYFIKYSYNNLYMTFLQMSFRRRYGIWGETTGTRKENHPHKHFTSWAIELICIHAYVCVGVCVCFIACMCVCVYVCMYVYVCMWVCVCERERRRAYVWINPKKTACISSVWFRLWLNEGVSQIKKIYFPWITNEIRFL